MSLITVKVIPNASKNEVIGWEDHNGQRILKAKVTATPDKGNANKALISLLADYFDCPKTEILLQRGTKNQTKVFEIQYFGKESVKNR